MIIKRMIKIYGLTFLLSAIIGRCYAQEELMSLLEESNKRKITYASATFKGGRLINGHSIETRSEKELEFLISHRFGRLNSGGQELFGLDNAFIRLGLEYGIMERITIGLGRSSTDKTFDGYVKGKLIRQVSRGFGSRVSITYFGSVAYKSVKGQEGFDTGTSKMAYCHQFLIARKFSSSFSFQVMPSLVHRNRLEERNGDNTLYAIGAGGRMKISKRISFNAEYYYRINAPDNDDLFNSIALGFDIETGGHVFQLHFTNSRAMIERGFIAETTGNFTGGDIHFGFNISRVF